MDIHIFNDENLVAQVQTAPFTLGFYTLHFFTENGRPVNRETATIGEYYLYPSGGTLRDASFNIIFYDSRFDTYRGFQPPHLKATGTPYS